MSEKQTSKTEFKEIIDLVESFLEEKNLSKVNFIKLIISKTLSSNDIVDIKDSLEQRLQEIRTEEMNKFIQEGKRMAQNLGIDPSTIAEALLGKKTKSAPASTAVAKYRSKENPNETWSGRGRKPAFVNDYLAADPNNKLEDLLI